MNRNDCVKQKVILLNASFPNLLLKNMSEQAEHFEMLQWLVGNVKSNHNHAIIFILDFMDIRFLCFLDRIVICHLRPLYVQRSFGSIFNIFLKAAQEAALKLIKDISIMMAPGQIKQ